MMTDDALLLMIIKNWHLLVPGAVPDRENLIDENQQRVSDAIKAGGFLPPDPGGDPPKLLPQKTILLSRGGPSAFG